MEKKESLRAELFYDYSIYLPSSFQTAYLKPCSCHVTFYGFIVLNVRLVLIIIFVGPGLGQPDKSMSSQFQFRSFDLLSQKLYVFLIDSKCVGYLYIPTYITSLAF